MLNLCGIVVAILKMATGRNCSMLGINLGHHNLPTYEMSLKSDNVEFVRYCGIIYNKTRVTDCYLMTMEKLFSNIMVGTMEKLFSNIMVGTRRRRRIWC